MKATLEFEGVVEFDQSSTQMVTVRQGKAFNITFTEFDADQLAGMCIATTADPVLSVIEDGRANGHLGMLVKAERFGVSEIQVQGPDREILFWLTIQVFNDEATRAIINTGETTPK